MNNKNIVYKILKESIPVPKLVLGIIFSVIGSILTLMIPQMIGKLVNNDVINYIITHKYIIGFLVVFIILLYFIKTISIYFLGSVGANSIENVQKNFFCPCRRPTFRGYGEIQIC